MGLKNKWSSPDMNRVRGEEQNMNMIKLSSEKVSQLFQLISVGLFYQQCPVHICKKALPIKGNSWKHSKSKCVYAVKSHRSSSHQPNEHRSFSRRHQKSLNITLVVKLLLSCLLKRRVQNLLLLLRGGWSLNWQVEVFL